MSESIVPHHSRRWRQGEYHDATGRDGGDNHRRSVRVRQGHSTIAQAFAQAGAATVIADIECNKAEEVAAEVAATGADSVAVGVDVSNPESLSAAVARCEERFGQLDIMVANAGIGQRPAAIDDTNAETLRGQFEVNALGAFNSCQAALPALRRRGEGASILITVSGIALMPRPMLYGYGMSKAAAMYLMKSLDPFTVIRNRLMAPNRVFG